MGRGATCEPLKEGMVVVMSEGPGVLFLYFVGDSILSETIVKSKM